MNDMETTTSAGVCTGRDGALSARDRRERSIARQLALAVGRPHGSDITVLTESTGAGRTVHGDFLFAEEIDDDQKDR